MLQVAVEANTFSSHQPILVHHAGKGYSEHFDTTWKNMMEPRAYGPRTLRSGLAKMESPYEGISHTMGGSYLGTGSVLTIRRR